MVGTKKKNKKSNIYKQIADHFEQLTEHAERFLKPQPEKLQAIQELIQLTYGASVGGDVANQADILPELVLEDMDEEQIWQQLEIRNELVLAQFLEQTATLTALREIHLGIELDEEDDEEEEQNQEAEEQPDSEDSEPETVAAKIKQGKQSNTKARIVKKQRRSVVDDTFFKLDEMKQFLEQEDAKELRKQNKKTANSAEDDEAVDYFADDFGIGEDDDEDDEENVNYADFFDMDEELQQAAAAQNGKQKDFFNENESEEEAEEAELAAGSEEEPSEVDESEFVAKSGVEPASDSESEEEDDEDDESKKQDKAEQQSSNELREARLFQRIRDYEEVVLGEKPWQLKGEVKAASRPQNSLLEEILEFDSTTRPTAPINEEDNRTIEELILQRIRDKAWDDVVATVRPIHTPQEYRKKLVLDQEKSKQSLAQVYEQQYQQELDKLDPHRSGEIGDESQRLETKEHHDIRRLMRSLFLKLDALSNFHFTPKPVAPEARIVTNTPAVHMEEVAPLAVSDAKLLAPEEIHRPAKHAPLGKAERTRTDKNRELRQKKQKQRAIHAALETRDQRRAQEGKAPTQRETNAKLLKTITKARNVQTITSSNDQGALKSSKAFFNKLQDNATATAASAGNKRPKKDASKANAKKLKL